MKTVQLFMELTVTDEYFENEMMSVKNGILSGKLQREIKQDSKDGVKKCKATFIELKTK
jgi:hypothetical protein